MLLVKPCEHHKDVKSISLNLMGDSELMDEFDIIKTYFQPLAENFGGSLSLIDDAALLNVGKDRQLVITNDILTAGVHFFENDPADFVARKSLRVNLSDIAAMGAKPVTYLLALSLPSPPDHSWLKLFSRGLQGDQDRYGICLSGGDTASTPGPLSISITMLGHIQANKALMRSTARSGDDIWVSGTIGDASVALKFLKGTINVGNLETRKYLLDRLHLPEPRLELGNALIGIASSVTDVSDGLVADLGNICSASGLGAIVKGAQIPLTKRVSNLMRESQNLKLSDLLSGGDDYELLFTAPPERACDINGISEAIGLNVCRIGSIVNNKRVRVIDGLGHDIKLEVEGFHHF